jgi:hypothetical protein
MRANSNPRGISKGHAGIDTIEGPCLLLLGTVASDLLDDGGYPSDNMAILSFSFRAMERTPLISI